MCCGDERLHWQLDTNVIPVCFWAFVFHFSSEAQKLECFPKRLKQESPLKFRQNLWYKTNFCCFLLRATTVTTASCPVSLSPSCPSPKVILLRSNTSPRGEPSKGLSQPPLTESSPLRCWTISSGSQDAGVILQSVLSFKQTARCLLLLPTSSFCLHRQTKSTLDQIRFLSIAQLHK